MSIENVLLVVDRVRTCAARLLGVVEGHVDPDKIVNDFGTLWFDPNFGICTNLLNTFDLDPPDDPRYASKTEIYDGRGIAYHFMNGCFESWSHFSGFMLWPVPASARVDGIPTNPLLLPAMQYSMPGLWSGNQQAFRVDLLKHIIKSAREMLEEAGYE